jgi:hypothetical protein
MAYQYKLKQKESEMLSQVEDEWAWYYPIKFTHGLFVATTDSGKIFVREWTDGYYERELTFNFG